VYEHLKLIVMNIAFETTMAKKCKKFVWQKTLSQNVCILGRPELKDATHLCSFYLFSIFNKLSCHFNTWSLYSVYKYTISVMHKALDKLLKNVYDQKTISGLVKRLSKPHFQEY
jgi:hypothetical protein